MLHIYIYIYDISNLMVNTSVSNTITLLFMVPFKTHVSQPYVTVGLMILQYSFNFDFLETSLLLKKHWLA